MATKDLQLAGFDSLRTPRAILSALEGMSLEKLADVYRRAEAAGVRARMLCALVVGVALDRARHGEHAAEDLGERFEVTRRSIQRLAKVYRDLIRPRLDAAGERATFELAEQGFYLVASQGRRGRRQASARAPRARRGAAPSGPPIQHGPVPARGLRRASGRWQGRAAFREASPPPLAGEAGRPRAVRCGRQPRRVGADPAGCDRAARGGAEVPSAKRSFGGLSERCARAVNDRAARRSRYDAGGVGGGNRPRSAICNLGVATGVQCTNAPDNTDQVRMKATGLGEPGRTK